MGSGERPKAPETDAAAGRAGDAMRGAAAIGARGGAAALGFGSSGSKLRGSEAGRARTGREGKGSDEEKEIGGGSVGEEEWKPREKRSKS